ncbi:type I-E CRISPR-associated endonuclease Cas1e [Jonesia quinghaiensis]|uniref:type I-E CRISPR-associated endonuclease Cas1e n=1 Tax=Jonesia quinghaiensis TaxID=262806 RepID=UPI0003F95629|nr:type I-E CRISPR-associated endonuclease Cas1e [Jonesia quinghaiensis]
MTLPGGRPPTSQELVRAQDRLSFIYLQHCTISRDSSAITATDERGTVHIPAAFVSCLLLGPGTRATHQAMSLLGESGASIVWVGENGVRFYAGGEPIARSSRLLIAQAEKASHERKRLAVARAMYDMRFPGEDTAGLTMQQLRGREGARVRRRYREEAEQHGVTWKKRDYTPGDFESGSPINQALTAAHSALYGIVHSVIVALGCAPGLGFVHTGNSRSFVYDIADLYKTDLSVPAAFSVVASGNPDISTAVRREMRDLFAGQKVLETCVKDLQNLLVGEELEEAETLADVVALWDPIGNRAAGVNYGWD